MPKKRNPDADSDEWCTPKSLADALGEFHLDPASNDRSHIRAQRRYTKADDGLSKVWEGAVFLNPPYSNPLPWCERLRDHKGPWVTLVKLDPTTKWWAALMAGCSDWAPFRSRIKFERPDKPAVTANFPNALVWYERRQACKLAIQLWGRK